VRLRFSEPAADRKNASQREYAIKSLRKAEKMRLITPEPLITI
jgi:predicted GIY-YIG superfamily endonuclease